MNYIMYCPNCGSKNTVQNNEKTRCINNDCWLTLVEQYHANGFQIFVRYDP